MDHQMAGPLGRGGSPARLEQRATRMVRDALVGHVGPDALPTLRYQARLAVPEGGAEPCLRISLARGDAAEPATRTIDLRQVFAGAALRDLVGAAVRSLLEQDDLLETRGAWVAPRPRAGGDGAEGN